MSFFCFQVPFFGKEGTQGQFCVDGEVEVLHLIPVGREKFFPDVQADVPLGQGRVHFGISWPLVKSGVFCHHCQPFPIAGPGLRSGGRLSSPESRRR